jgi:predicted phosphodiesterase
MDAQTKEQKMALLAARLAVAVAARERPGPKGDERRFVELPDGIIIAAGDAHYWPGRASTAHRALVHMCTHLKPNVMVLMGDIIDGSTVSRWPVGSWIDHAGRPTIIAEVAAAQERLREISAALDGSAELHWVMGNHDGRFETYLIEHAPEFAGVEGTRLKDHFPLWTPSWSVRVNDGMHTPTVLKHRWKGGEHAAFNNAVKAGTNIVTGHLHALQVSPYTDYRGTRYGVDSGTLAVPYGPQFVHYTEDNPVNWRSGFAVLTFVGGRLLPPEIVQVIDEAAGLVCFRGQLLEV